MKMQKNIMMQSDKNLLEEKQIWEKERAMLLKKIEELEQKNKKYEIQLDKTQAILPLHLKSLCNL